MLTSSSFNICSSVGGADVVAGIGGTIAGGAATVATFADIAVPGLGGSEGCSGDPVTA